MSAQAEWLDLPYPQRVAEVIVAARSQGASITEADAHAAVELDALVRAFGPGWEDQPIPYDLTEKARRLLVAGEDQDHDDGGSHG